MQYAPTLTDEGAEPEQTPLEFGAVFLDHGPEASFVDGEDDAGGLAADGLVGVEG